MGAGLSVVWLHKKEQMSYAGAVVYAFVVARIVTQDVLYYSVPRN